MSQLICFKTVQLLKVLQSIILMFAFDLHIAYFNGIVWLLCVKIIKIGQNSFVFCVSFLILSLFFIM